MVGSVGLGDRYIGALRLRLGRPSRTTRSGVTIDLTTASSTSRRYPARVHRFSPASISSRACRDRRIDDCAATATMPTTAALARGRGQGSVLTNIALIDGSAGPALRHHARRRTASFLRRRQHHPWRRRQRHHRGPRRRRSDRRRCLAQRAHQRAGRTRTAPARRSPPSTAWQPHDPVHAQSAPTIPGSCRSYARSSTPRNSSADGPNFDTAMFSGALLLMTAREPVQQYRSGSMVSCKRSIPMVPTALTSRDRHRHGHRPGGWRRRRYAEAHRAPARLPIRPSCSCRMQPRAGGRLDDHRHADRGSAAHGLDRRRDRCGQRQPINPTAPLSPTSGRSRPRRVAASLRTSLSMPTAGEVARAGGPTFTPAMPRPAELARARRLQGRQRRAGGGFLGADRARRQRQRCPDGRADHLRHDPDGRASPDGQPR